MRRRVCVENLVVALSSRFISHIISLILSLNHTNFLSRPSLEEVRNHPFFTMHQIPGSLPSTCTISAPIWATDEFGELNAIKPTSALDIPSSSNNKAAAGNTNAKKGGTFNIYDEVNEQGQECKLESNPIASSPSIEPRPVTAGNTPVNKLTGQMAACNVADDEVRDLPPCSTSTAAAEPQQQPKQLLLSPQEATAGSKTAASATTPAPQSSPSASNDDLNELVMMHSRLEECLVNYERIQNGGAKVECPLKGGEVWGANKWVTRYVDYTSKYGLGFLLNDGSSGVYFNDSTKAVHSADGDSFIYVERRKTDTGGVREPVSMYSVTNYPEETLKKKVTLLQHFRSYLLEQQKRAEDAGEVEPLSSNFEERRDVASSSRENDDDDDESATAPMVFMKKWIKTKHAMLFRLSNGTIQVLFHDLTEVLISSEGNLITFVDKEKNRFVHSIAEIANKQHGDISRRLKYAKDILTQLISASKR